MRKDGKPIRLTKEEAVKLHREMWRDMAKEEEKLGEPINRGEFKGRWCDDHGYQRVNADCFLCAYILQIGGSCDNCPINWGIGDDGKPMTCGEVPGSHDMDFDEIEEYLKEHPEVIHYNFSPIEKVAEAPLKEDKGNILNHAMGLLKKKERI